ncbi:hypothetical protein [Nonomuraea dietziae]|uniref:hypothetical protein n=1 Tax=Nonomuraea dietziae TaxID=65515 RepID=UPI0031CF2821
MKELILATALALTPATATGPTVKVYFSADLGIPGKVVAVSRKAPDSGVAKFAVQQLIKGPTKAERKRGCTRSSAVRSRAGRTAAPTSS